MKLLVSGATGFVGSFLCQSLAAAGHEVVAISRSGEVSPRLQVHSLVTTLEELSERDLAGADAFVHLAGIAHRRGAEAAVFSQVNCDLTIDVFEKAQRAEVGAFVYLSTAKVHGDGSPTGYRSTDPLKPTDAYGRSKADAELAIGELACATALTILRPPVIYGPEPKGNIAHLLRMARRGVPLPVPRRPNRRSFIGIQNLCDVIEVAATSTDAGRRAFLIADASPVSTATFFKKLSNALGRRGTTAKLPTAVLAGVDRVTEKVLGHALLEPLYTDFWFDDDDFSRTTGWVPRLSLESGIRHMLSGSSGG